MNVIGKIFTNRDVGGVGIAVMAGVAAAAKWLGGLLGASLTFLLTASFSLKEAEVTAPPVWLWVLTVAAISFGGFLDERLRQGTKELDGQSSVH